MFGVNEMEFMVIIPSMLFIKLSDGNYIGYSNVRKTSKDANPKTNTNMTAFYSKLRRQKTII